MQIIIVSHVRCIGHSAFPSKASLLSIDIFIRLRVPECAIPVIERKWGSKCEYVGIPICLSGHSTLSTIVQHCRTRNHRCLLSTK
jgi:hypothetical protein